MNFSSPKQHANRRGVALIVALSVLVLVAALIVILMNRVTIDRANASSFRASIDSRILRDYVVNAVRGQITTATTQDPRLAWASQPGAIRTYSATGSGLETIYKLYSAPDLTGNDTNTLTGDRSAISNWKDNTALFTDLNAPVTRSSGTKKFPILDPGALGKVQGFEITSAPGSSADQLAPMPVWWLYVLQDGTLEAPTDAGSNTVNVPGASTANPIVGRVAFWTDDETSKININTASGAPREFYAPANNVTTTWAQSLTVSNPANFWDVPMVRSSQDYNLAVSQPWRGEYQRYPGHPATVSLSMALPSLDTQIQIDTIAARIEGGGSQGGRVVSTTPTLLADSGVRLFPSVDELRYQPATRGSAPSLSTQEIEEARFFLTAQSRAPDVTPFNTPKLLTWPLTVGKLTPFDKLIQFCGTVGPDASFESNNSYYFTRLDPLSSTSDYNRSRNLQLMSYLRNMATATIPGFGGSGILAKHGADQDQIMTEIFDFIRTLNSQDNSVPTAGGTADASYHFAPGSWIIPTVVAANNTRGFGRFPTISKAAILFRLDTTSAAPQKRLQAALLLETFVPSLGWPSLGGGIRFRPKNLGNLRWRITGGTEFSIFLNNSPLNTYFGSGTWGQRPYGGRQGFRHILSPASYPFETSRTTEGLSVPANATSFDFAGGDIEMDIIHNGISRQTVTLTFPPALNLPIPTIGGASMAARQAAAVNLESSGNMITGNDVVLGISSVHGDFRLLAAQDTVPGTDFGKLDDYGTLGVVSSHRLLATSDGRWFKNSTVNTFLDPSTASKVLVNMEHRSIGSDVGSVGSAAGMQRGDWDNGTGAAMDGPYINWPDEGNTLFLSAGNPRIPYFSADHVAQSVAPTMFTPNRLVPSPGIFGSLPTGVKRNIPWQTLLFRPAALTSAGHLGLGNPPDHLLLDLFNMPVVEPYAISEPLSTDGRVNMNYQIQPFTYIHRSTAVQAVLHTERIGALRSNLAVDYDTALANDAGQTRFPINLDKVGGTLEGFEDRFANNDLFIYPSEICTIPLVPQGENYDDMTNWWNNHRLTGENVKERPYARIYPKLTTKSNTFTVHYRVEVLKKSGVGNAGQWNDASDKVVSALRGSTSIERYVNPRDPNLPDFASLTLPVTGANALPNFYQWRILSESQFNP